jgi:hypothetical protein
VPRATALVRRATPPASRITVPAPDGRVAASGCKSLEYDLRQFRLPRACLVGGAPPSTSSASQRRRRVLNQIASRRF